MSLFPVKKQNKTKQNKKKNNFELWKIGCWKVNGKKPEHSVIERAGGDGLGPFGW